MWLQDRWRELSHPEAGHDRGRSPYFEGWYVKLVDSSRQVRLALIPGLFRSAEGVAEAFVQVLDGATGRSWYVRYPADEYWASPHGWAVQVGPNRFTPSGVDLDLHDAADDLAMTGAVRFTTPFDQWPITPLAPGAMGWYAYMPFLECYHGVVSFRHDLSGALVVNGRSLELHGGRGYVEQDWGQAFPAAYVWMHSNHFVDPDLSLMGSMALIPWLRGEFRGMLIGLRTSDELHRFATYTGAKTESLTIDDEHVRCRVRARNGNVLELRAERVGGALLHVPVRDQMHQRLEETLDATIELRLTDRHGRVLIEDAGDVAGLEVHGSIQDLVSSKD